MIQRGTRRRYPYTYRKPHTPLAAEHAAAREVCALVGKLLGVRRARLHTDVIPDLLDAYEDWRATATPLNADGRAS